MAKGALFTVFSDPAGPAPKRSAPAGANVNKPGRALGPAPGLNQARGIGLSDENGQSGWNGKENFDPFAPTLVGPKALAKAKGDSAGCAFLSGPSKKALATKLRPFKLGPAQPSATNGVGSGTLQHASASTGICTGTVRVRTVPSSTWGGRSPKKAPTQTRPVELRPKQVAASKAVIELALPSPSLSVSSVMSRASSKDSGYASRPRSMADDDESAEDNEMSDNEMDVKGKHQLRNTSGKLVGKLLPCCAGSETLGDRRARGLTESPLAEVSQTRHHAPQAFPTRSSLRPRPLTSLFSFVAFTAHRRLRRHRQLLSLFLAPRHRRRPLRTRLLQALGSPFPDHPQQNERSLLHSDAPLHPHLANQRGPPAPGRVERQSDARLNGSHLPAADHQLHPSVLKLVHTRLSAVYAALCLVSPVPCADARRPFGLPTLVSLHLVQLAALELSSDTYFFFFFLFVFHYHVPML